MTATKLERGSHREGVPADETCITGSGLFYFSLSHVSLYASILYCLVAALLHCWYVDGENTNRIYEAISVQSPPQLISVTSTSIQL
jgi:hypothetical protein